MKRERRLAAALAIVGVLLSGCAQVHTGEAQRDPGYNPNAANLALLDPGNYPTRPSAPLGLAGTPEKGAILEAHRMAEYVVFPFQIDPTFKSKFPLNGGVMDTPDSVGSGLFTPALAPIMAAHNFVTGFAAANTARLQNTVLMFKTDVDATAAAGEMVPALRDKASSYADTPHHLATLAVSDHPATTAFTWSQTNQYDDSVSAVAVTPHGRYVLVQKLYLPRSTQLDPALLVGKTLDKQIPLIDSFTPTSSDQLVNLPMDPSELRARVIPPSKEDTTAEDGEYGTHGALLYYPRRPEDAQKMFADNGVDVIISGDSFVTRTKDAAGAQRFADWLVADAKDDGWNDIDGVYGLPSARCHHREPESSFETMKYRCTVAIDRFVLETSSAIEVDAKQKLAAGYLMLTAK